MRDEAWRVTVTEGDREVVRQLGLLLGYGLVPTREAEIVAVHREAAVAELEHMLDSAQDAVAAEREKVRKLVEAATGFDDAHLLSRLRGCTRCEEKIDRLLAALAEYKGVTDV